jgi:hypothetical protein
MRKLLLSLLATVFASGVAAAADNASSSPPVAEGAIPSAYVWLSGGTVAIGIGYSWGHGTLYYSKNQKEYKFKLSGVSVADVGAAGINAEGEVYNLGSRPTACTLRSNKSEGTPVAAGVGESGARGSLAPVDNRVSYQNLYPNCTVSTRGRSGTADWMNWSEFV